MRLQSAARQRGVNLLAHVLTALPERSPEPALTADDLERMWEAASEHGVESPLAFWLERTDRRHALVAEALWREFQLQLLHEITEALEGQGIDAVSLKGPVLVERLYPRGAGRTSVDLDILLAERDLDPSLVLLERMGFRPVDLGLPLAVYRSHVIHVELERPGSPHVEVHFRFSVFFGRIVGSEAALARKVRYRTTLGHDVWVLAPEDEFLFLALHAAKHSFHQLVWLFELKLFVLRHPGLDWEAVSYRARQLDVQTALWAAAQALSRRLGFDVPLGRVRVHPSLLARWVWNVERHARSAAREPRSLSGWLSHHADHLLLCDNAARRLAYFRQQVGRGVRWRLAARLRL